MIQLEAIEKAQRKPAVAAVRSGDSVRVHQLIKEGSKQRVQIFHGVVIKTARLDQHSASITVRRIASGVGVEKSFLLHSPNITKVEVIRRAKVRRNFLVYLRDRHGKAARLTELGFDRAAVNVADQPAVSADAAADDVDEANDNDTELDREAEAEAGTTVDDTDTELDPDALEEVDATISTEELGKAEDKAAAADDPASDENVDTDEAQLDISETEAGLDRADRSDN